MWAFSHLPNMGSGYYSSYRMWHFWLAIIFVCKLYSPKCILSALMCYVYLHVIYIPLQRCKLWLIIDDAYNSVRLMLLSIRLMHMGLWHTAVMSCHCDNPLVMGYWFLKEQILIMFLLSGSSHPWPQAEAEPPPEAIRVAPATPIAQLGGWPSKIFN